MQFIKCIASKTNLFNNVTLDLGHRVVIIYGKNSSGKTIFGKSLIDGIFKRFSNNPLLGKDVWKELYLDIVFSLPETDIYQFINKSNNLLTINNNNDSEENVIYSETIEGKSEKNGIKIEPVNPNKINGAKELKDFLNYIDGTSFFNTSFIQSPSDLDRDRVIDYSVIKNVILNDHSDFYPLHVNFENTFKNDNLTKNKLNSEMLRHEGMLKDINKKVQMIDIQKSKIVKLNVEKNNIKKETSELNDSLVFLEKKRNIFTKILENLTRIELLNKDLDSIGENVQKEKDKIKKVKLYKEELRNLYPQFKGLGLSNNVILDKLQNLFNQVRNVDEEINDFDYIRDKRKKFIKKYVWVSV